MSQALRIFVFTLPMLIATSSFAQEDRPADRRPREEPRLLTPIAAAEDDEFQALRSAITPDEALWKSMTERYDVFRRAQLDAMRTAREELRGQHGGEGPPPREDMERALNEVLPPIRETFLQDLRVMVPAEKQHDFDHWANGATFDPPRPPSRNRNRGQLQSEDGPLPPNSVSITIKDGFRYFTANGIPDHDHGRFPGPGNPNSISAQQYSFRVSEKPVAKENGVESRGVLAGIALNGVVLDPGTAEFWKDDPSTGWRLEAIAPHGVQHRSLGIDSSNAHVQPSGAYHYHGAPTGLIERIAKERGVVRGSGMLLLGYSADGFPIYDAFGPTNPNELTSPIKPLRSSYRLKTQERPAGNEGPGGKPDGIYTRDWEFVKDSGDLDECNGRFGVTPEYPDGTYYYVITDTFPYIHRRFKGQPDDSFRKHDGPPTGREGGRRSRQNAR